MRGLKSFVRAYGQAVGILLVAAAIASNGYAVRVALTTQKQQDADRTAAQLLPCAATDAVIDAGRAAILSGAEEKSPQEEKTLSSLGFPLATRQLEAATASAAYAGAIASAVRSQTGRADLVDEDGSLKCEVLR